MKKLNVNGVNSSYNVFAVKKKLLHKYRYLLQSLPLKWLWHLKQSLLSQ